MLISILELLRAEARDQHGENPASMSGGVSVTSAIGSPCASPRQTQRPRFLSYAQPPGNARTIAAEA
jgi:hypothetical protein